VLKTIAEYFETHRSSGKFLHEVETGQRKTFDEVYQGALSRANTFCKDDQKIISVILPNSITYIEYNLASLMTGNIFNPIPYFVSIRELEKVLGYVGPKYIVTDRQDIYEHFKDKYEVIRPDAIQEGEGIKPKDIDEDLPAALYYSSGTTGNPKGVLYSHKNMVSLIDSIIRGFRFESSDNQLAFLPFGHTASINYNILPSLMVGCNLYISQGFEFLRTDFFKVLDENKITYVEVVPTVILMLLKLNLKVSECDLSWLKFIGCGSSTLPLVSQKQFIEKYGIKVGNLYGLSETGPSHIDYPLDEGWEPGSIGVPLDVNKCKIAQDGEILLNGDNVFIGYYKNKNGYDDVVKDGWFHTGDIGSYENGKFYYVDRKKDLIIKGGINIVPMEVEEAIYKDLGVHECVVVGEENSLLGEDVVAVVVPKKEVEEKEFIKGIKDICKNELSNYKVPSKVFVWKELPKTHSNKLLRRKVRETINQR